MSKLFASGGPSGALRGTPAGDAPRPRLVVWGPHTTRLSPNYDPAVCMRADGWNLAIVAKKDIITAVSFTWLRSNCARFG